MNIRNANLQDMQDALNLDRHISAETYTQLINLKRIYVAEIEGKIVGILRYNFFWDEIPFLNLIQVSNDFQKRGIGKGLIEYFEKAMKAFGCSKIMTSSLSNEDAQNFYRKLGYKDIGGFTLPNEALEIIFFKEI